MPVVPVQKALIIGGNEANSSFANYAVDGLETDLKTTALGQYNLKLFEDSMIFLEMFENGRLTTLASYQLAIPVIDPIGPVSGSNP